MREAIALSYATTGSYSVNLEIYQPNGTPYLSDTLGWEYSTEVPDPPIVSFSELATSDTSVSLLVAGNRKPYTNEIWVEGDLAGQHASGGFWAPLPDSNIYLLQVTAADGEKRMTVKLRNVFGNESAPVQTSIVKKSTGPTGCRAEMDGTGSASRTVFLQLFATNDGPLYYDVTGDVDAVTDFQSFASGAFVPVKLSTGAGQKRIKVRIRDAASNYCDDIEHTLTLSGDYVQQTIAVAGNPLWTESATVDLSLRFDHYPSQAPIEMRLTGGIQGSDVGAWIPYATSKTVTLSNGSGDKKIFAQFRDNTGDESFLVMAQVFSKPTVSSTGAGATKTLTISNIRGLTHATITGCAETYNAVPYAATYDCTVADPTTVSVTFTFSDGTTLTKSPAP